MESKLSFNPRGGIYEASEPQCYADKGEGEGRSRRELKHTFGSGARFASTAPIRTRSRRERPSPLSAQH